MDIKEAIIYITNKVKDLEDDYSHEKFVELNQLNAHKIRLEIAYWDNVLEVLKENKEDDHNNAKDFLYDKISILEEELIDEKDKARISYIKYDLDKYNGILELLRKAETNLYSKVRHNYIAQKGEIDGYQYVIRSTGDHPCAYIGLKNLFSKYDPEKIEEDLSVHGGVTFKSCDWYLDDLDSSFDWIGWDYAHCGDYCVWMDKDSDNISNRTEENHKYTCEEILEDIKKAINDLKTLLNNNPDLEYTCVMCGKKFIPEHGYQDTCFDCMCKYADWISECGDGIED